MVLCHGSGRRPTVRRLLLRSWREPRPALCQLARQTDRHTPESPPVLPGPQQGAWSLWERDRFSLVPGTQSTPEHGWKPGAFMGLAPH